MQTLGILIYVASLLANAVLARRFGERITATKVPMQWRLNGTPSWFAPRAVALNFIPVLTFVFGAFILVLAWTSNGTNLWFALCAFCIACVIAQFWHLRKAQRLEDRAGE